MPGSTRREHAGTSTRDPVTSTTHTRQTLTGVNVGILSARRPLLSGRGVQDHVIAGKE